MRTNGLDGNGFSDFRFSKFDRTLPAKILHKQVACFIERAAKMRLKTTLVNDHGVHPRGYTANSAYFGLL